MLVVSPSGDGFVSQGGAVNPARREVVTVLAIGFALFALPASAGAATLYAQPIKPGAPDQLTVAGGRLFYTEAFSVQLWKSDGTAAGTVLVKDINPGGFSGLHNLTNVAGTLYFTADDGTNGEELWKSDGTDAGTVMVKDINSGVGGSQARTLTNVGGTLFFAANDGVNGEELWKSDGTDAGTVMVKNITPGSASSGIDPNADHFAVTTDGLVYFGAS